ncbi:hypothetical protein NIES592_10255 [Fischerella major NIES-592]|uniref:Uncharacterized protein n=1 Tax=Fischerella major NIES-592 TaxID=210994 RepID=A0A1U7H0N4_9CYAN|nr:hypothetical protein NIES592_10255 [Fischerella major NIES-592]
MCGAGSGRWGSGGSVRGVKEIFYPCTSHTPPLREALWVIFEKPGFARLRGFAIVTESGASAVDGSPGIKHLASKTATPSLLRVYIPLILLILLTPSFKPEKLR